VAPNSEINTRLKWIQCVNASLSGCADVMPVDLMCWKMGDSFILRRMYSDTTTSAIEMRNGRRQPHARKASADIAFWTRRMTASDTNRPRVAVIWMKLV
jgi:hypothetical protein